jgi:hypothetical protein
MESKTMRRRINVTRGMTGKISYDCTVEAEGYTEADVLEASDRLVTQLEARYPAEVPAPVKEVKEK